MPQSIEQNNKYAKVVFEIALDKSFDYIIPSHLQDKIFPGSIVKAPFGEKVLDGYVIELTNQSNIEKLKELIEVSGEQVLLETHLFDLAKWMSEYYICPLGLVLKAVYPSYLKEYGKKRRNTDSIFLSLTKNREENIKFIDLIKGKATKQADLMTHLMRRSEVYIPFDEIKETVKTDRKVLESLKTKGYLEIFTETELKKRDIQTSKYKYVDQLKVPNLTDDQASVLNSIYDIIKSNIFSSILLHGVTGSGKTEIYLRAIEKTINDGKQAIMLIPEISLTPQTEERFRKRFGDCVAVFHSRLSDIEREKEWRKMRSGEAKLVVGARSAVFAPFKNLGLIVVDEEHERSYKQEESPRYNARDVSVVRAKMANIPVILGSATPSLESIHNYQAGKYNLMELPSRVDNRPMPLIHVVDLAKEVKEEKQWVVLTYPLREKIRDRLEKGEQIILFLNRRGFSSMAMCQHCGYVYECPSCSLSLTYHKSIEKLTCHFCGYMIPRPVFCVKCGSTELKYTGMGTQKVERILKSSFPEARVLRMDSDTTTQKNSHFELLNQFKRGKADILIGTQMIAKGLDFPRVTLVGVILAESSLKLPDFRASELTFQILTQVSGRAGRGELPGEVVIQTFMQSHPSVTCAVKQDYHLFVTGELSARKSLRYPPYCRFINIIISGKDKKKGEWTGVQLAKLIQRTKPVSCDIKGPFPAVVHKKNESYYWNIMIKSENIYDINKCIRLAMSKCDKLYGIKIGVDVDPYYMW